MGSLQFIIFKAFFFFLKILIWKAELHKEKESSRISIPQSPPQMFKTVKVRPIQSQHSRVYSRCPMWVQGRRDFSHPTLLSRAISRKLDHKWSNQDMGDHVECWLPGRGLMRYTTVLAPF